MDTVIKGYHFLVTHFLINYGMDVLPDIRHPQLNLGLNVGICDIQDLECWGWVGYGVLWRRVPLCDNVV